MCKWFMNGMPCPEWGIKGTCKRMHSVFIRGIVENAMNEILETDEERQEVVLKF